MYIYTLSISYIYITYINIYRENIYMLSRRARHKGRPLCISPDGRGGTIFWYSARCGVTLCSVANGLVLRYTPSGEVGLSDALVKLDKWAKRPKRLATISRVVNRFYVLVMGKTEGKPIFHSDCASFRLKVSFLLYVKGLRAFWNARRLDSLTAPWVCAAKLYSQAIQKAAQGSIGKKVRSEIRVG